MGDRTRTLMWGMLTDYITGEAIRPATEREHHLSSTAGPTGVFVGDEPARAVFVAGGPEATKRMVCPRCGSLVDVPVPQRWEHRCECGNRTAIIRPETPDPFAHPGDRHQRTA